MLVLEQVGVAAEDFEDVVQLDLFLERVLLLVENLAFDERAQAAFEEEDWHQVHVVVRQHELLAPLVPNWLEFNQLVLVQLLDLQFEAFDVTFNDSFHGPHSHVCFYPLFALEIVVHHAGLL